MQVAFYREPHLDQEPFHEKDKVLDFVHQDF